MSVVLVDSSVWIERFRHKDCSAVTVLAGLIQENLVCTIGLVRAELLSGARSPSEYRRLEAALESVELLEDPPDLWDMVALARFQLARKGFKASIADLIVAASASHHQAQLFTLDAAFQEIKTVLPLALLPSAH